MAYKYWTSVNEKNGEVYVDLPTPEQRDKLLPLLKEEAVVPGNTIVDVKLFYSSLDGDVEGDFLMKELI